MGASQSISGPTEAATLLNQLRWLNGWSKKMLRSLRMMYNAIETVRAKHHFGCSTDGCDKTFFLSILDEMVVLLDGPATEMRHSFHMHHCGSDDGELPIHIALEKNMEEIENQCKGLVPVPVDAPFEWVPKKEPIPSVPATFASYVKQICGLSAKIQEVLGGLEFSDGISTKDPAIKPNRPHFIVNMTIVDNHGRPIKIEGGFDIEKLVNEYNEKRMQEAAAKALPPGKEANGEVQPSSPN